MNTFKWSDESRSQWNNRAEYWHSNSKEMWDNGSRMDIIPFVKEYIPVGSIVDLGCGDGYGSNLLSEAGYNVVGMDISQKMVHLATNNFSKENLTFVEGNLINTPFDNEQFTGAMAINSLEWTENPLSAINEIKRITISGGYACIGILGPTAQPRINSFPRLEGKEVICNTMMPWEFEKLAINHGWEKVAEKGVYKRGVTTQHLSSLSNELKQALTFMNLFILKKLA